MLVHICVCSHFPQTVLDSFPSQSAAQTSADPPGNKQNLLSSRFKGIGAVGLKWAESSVWAHMMISDVSFGMRVTLKRERQMYSYTMFLRLISRVLILSSVLSLS